MKSNSFSFIEKFNKSFDVLGIDKKALLIVLQENEISNLTQTVALQDEEIDSLNEELEMQSLIIEAQEEQIADLQEEVCELEIEIEELEERIGRLEEDLLDYTLNKTINAQEEQVFLKVLNRVIRIIR